MTLHIVDLWQYYLCCTRSGVIQCNLFMVLFLSYVPVRVARGAVIAHRYTYAPPRCRTSQYCRTFVTPYSMVSDWRVSRAWPMNFHSTSCSLPFCLQLFSLALLSFYGLVFWDCGLRTDSVNRGLPALHCQPFLNNNNNHNIKICSTPPKKFPKISIVKFPAILEYLLH